MRLVLDISKKSYSNIKSLSRRYGYSTSKVVTLLASSSIDPVHINNTALYHEAMQAADKLMHEAGMSTERVEDDIREFISSGALLLVLIDKVETLRRMEDRKRKYSLVDVQKQILDKGSFQERFLNKKRK